MHLGKWWHLNRIVGDEGGLDEWALAELSEEFVDELTLTHGLVYIHTLWEAECPTGKDSLSLSQQYPNGEKIISPGTVIVSAGGEVSDIKKVVSPVLVNDKNASLYHIDFSFDEQRLGGSAFAQSLGKVGDDVPTVKNPEYFADAFMAVQQMIEKGWILAPQHLSVSTPQQEYIRTSGKKTIHPRQSELPD